MSAVRFSVWRDWFNNRRLLEPIGDIPPVEYEEAYYRGQQASGSSPGVQVTKTKLLIKIGFLYHKAAFDPLIDLFLADDRYDVYFALDEERVRRFGIFTRPFRPPLLDELERSGYRFTDRKDGFDVVLTGDPLIGAERYGDTLRCFLNHGTGIKSILYRHLAKNMDTRYEIFVEGQYRVDRIRESGALGKSEIHLVGLPKLDYLFQGRIPDRATLLKRWGLDPAKRTVLFAPTYKPTCMYDVKDALFEATRDHNLIIKLHHYSWMGRYAPHRQHRIFETPREAVPARRAPADGGVQHRPVHGGGGHAPERGVEHGVRLPRARQDRHRLRPSRRSPHPQRRTPDPRGGQPRVLEGRVRARRGAGRASRRASRGRSIPTPEMRAAADRERAYRFFGLDGRASERVKAKIEELLSARSRSGA